MILALIQRTALLGFFLIGTLASGAYALQSSDDESRYPPTPASVDSIMVLIDAAHFAEAESLGWVLVQEMEATKGPESFEVARTLDAYLEARLRNRRDDPEVEPLIERALTIKRTLLGPDHPEIARTLGYRSKLLANQGRLEEAIEVGKERLVILRKDPGPDPAMLASAAAFTGILHGMLARYEEATPYLLEALEVYSRTYGENYLETGGAAINVGNLYYMRADYAQAQVYYERALKSFQASLDPDHPRIMTAHYSLGGVYRLRGDYAGAREHYTTCLELAEQRDRPESDPKLVGSLRGLANLQTELGNHEEALALEERSLKLSETTHGPESFEILADLTNLGLSYRVLDRNEEAREVLSRAIQIGTERSPEHDQLVAPLAQMGLVEQADGNYEAALDYLERSLAIANKVLGPTHDQTGKVHAFLGAVYEDMGDYEASESHLSAAIEAFESGWRNQQYYARCLLQRSRVRFATERYRASFEDAHLGEQNARAHYLFTLRSLSEKDALTFAASRGNGIPLMISLALVETDLLGSSVQDVWDAVIRSRGLLLEEISARRRLARDVEDPNLSELSLAVLDARTRLANLYLQGPEGEDLEQFTNRLDEIAREKEAAEAEFAVRSAGFRSDEETRAAGIEEVASALPEGGALVAYVRYIRHQPGVTPTSSYAAFVLSSGSEAPVLVDLGPADRIDESVAAWRDALAYSTAPSGPLAETAEQKVRESGESVRAAMLDPLIPHLGDADPVLMVPAGSLHLVNPAALPSEDGGYLVETGPAYHLLPAERAILPTASGGPTEPGLLALGDPEFDASEVNTPSQGEFVVASRVNMPLRGGGPDCDQFLELRFLELPGARRESEEIAALWSETQSGEATVLVGNEATEAAFKEAAPGHSVLHLATHGYFLSSECAMEKGADSTFATTLFELVQGNPLLLSGLAMSGANQRGESSGGEDGVLTAEEIATLDLEGVEWVVLSACDTGRGELREGAGVFGLQRAFQTAGARTVIMSLWEVDDQATRDWMKAVYRMRWQDGQGTAQAVRQASLLMLQKRREAGLGTSPVTWGAFVATGDWR